MTKFIFSIVALFGLGISSMYGGSQYVFVNALTPTTAPFYATVLQETVNTALLSGGAMAATVVTAGTTNTNMWSTPVNLSCWDTIVVKAECTQAITNGTNQFGTSTNWAYLWPSTDGVVPDMLHPIATLGPITSSGTSYLWITNISATQLGSVPYLFAGWASLSATNIATNTVGTNASTYFTNYASNIFLQVITKKKVVSVTPGP